MARDDLSAETVRLEILTPGGECRSGREVAQQVALGDRIIRQATLQQVAHERKLRVREQDAQLRSHEHLAALASLDQHVRGRQALGAAVQLSGLLQGEHQISEVVVGLAGPPLIQRDRQTL